MMLKVVQDFNYFLNHYQKTQAKEGVTWRKPTVAIVRKKLEPTDPYYGQPLPDLPEENGFTTFKEMSNFPFESYTIMSDVSNVFLKVSPPSP